MKFFFVLSIMMFVSQIYSYSQPYTVVNKNEMFQVLDKFVYMSNLPNHYRNNGYVVKLINEHKRNSYSIAISSISYFKELPKDSMYCLIYHDVGFFIVHSSDISLDTSEIESTNILINIDTIRKFAYEVFKDYYAQIGFPTIMVFKATPFVKLGKRRKILFETYHPINTLSKKYWPIQNPQYVITDRPFMGYLDKRGKPNQLYFNYLKNGKGKFKIKIR